MTDGGVNGAWGADPDVLDEICEVLRYIVGVRDADHPLLRATRRSLHPGLWRSPEDSPTFAHIRLTYDELELLLLELRKRLDCEGHAEIGHCRGPVELARRLGGRDG